MPAFRVCLKPTDTFLLPKGEFPLLAYPSIYPQTIPFAIAPLLQPVWMLATHHHPPRLSKILLFARDPCPGTLSSTTQASLSDHQASYQADQNTSRSPPKTYSYVFIHRHVHLLRGDQNTLPLSFPRSQYLSWIKNQDAHTPNLQDSLTLDDKMPNDKLQPPLPAQRKPTDQLAAPSTHRPSKSQEEALRAKKPVPGPRPEASPHRKPPAPRRPRRNSESSVMDFSALPITPEEMKMIEAKRLRDRQREKAAREAREAREPRESRESRESRETRDKERASKSRSKSGRPSRRMDLIDQLDATSIYGTGRK